MFNFSRKRKKEESDASILQIFGMLAPLLLAQNSTPVQPFRYEIDMLIEKYHELDKRLMIQESKSSVHLEKKS